MSENIPATGIDDNPAPQYAQLDPAAIQQITNTVVANVRPLMAPQVVQPQMPAPSYFEAWKENQVKLGGDSAALDQLAIGLAALERDKMTQAQIVNQQRAVEQAWLTFWAMLDDAFDDVATKLPALQVAKPGLFDQIHALLVGGQRFPDISNQFAAQGKITKSMAAKLVAHVSDEYLKSIGVTRAEAPVSTKNSSPAQTGRTTGDGKPVFLDLEQETIYRQFRGELGDDAAMEIARMHKR